MFTSAVISLGFLALSAHAVVHDVTVGGPAGQLEYNPQAIAAQPGDQVVFHFQQKNHTATQSSFANPCGPKDGGFTSGFMPVAANVTDNFPTYTVSVNDMNPIWVYCAQAAGTPNSHCGKGMVFAINCGTDGSPNSFTNFMNSALAVGASLNAAAPSSAAGGYGGGYGYGAPSPTDTPAAAPAAASSTTGATAAGATHTVVVGGSGLLAFDPPEVSAQPNDMVVFQFQSKNHTVTQSSFGAPCQELAASSTSGQTGFDSGFMPVTAGSSDFPTYSILVNDTAPIWAYCRQQTPASHCGQGMVLAINAVDNGPKNFTAFQAAARSGSGTSSGGASPAGGASSSTSDASRMGFSTSLALGLVGAVFAVLL